MKREILAGFIVYFMKDSERLLSELRHYFLHLLHAPGRHDPLIIVPEKNSLEVSLASDYDTLGSKSLSSPLIYDITNEDLLVFPTTAL